MRVCYCNTPPERVHKEDVDGLASGVIRRGVVKIESYELKVVIVRVEHHDERALLVLRLQDKHRHGTVYLRQ